MIANMILFPGSNMAFHELSLFVTITNIIATVESNNIKITGIMEQMIILYLKLCFRLICEKITVTNKHNNIPYGTFDPYVRIFNEAVDKTTATPQRKVLPKCLFPSLYGQ